MHGQCVNCTTRLFCRQWSSQSAQCRREGLVFPRRRRGSGGDWHPCFVRACVSLAHLLSALPDCRPACRGGGGGLSTRCAGRSRCLPLAHITAFVCHCYFCKRTGVALEQLASVPSNLTVKLFIDIFADIISVECTCTCGCVTCRWMVSGRACEYTG